MSPRSTPRALALATTALLALVLVTTWSAYQIGLNGPFLLDDGVVIPAAQVATLSSHELYEHTRSSRFGGHSRSLGKLAFALTQYASGYVPSVFKRQNVLLHLANGLLIYWLSALLFSLPRQKPASLDFLTATVPAGLWLLHPLHVSTVLYAVQQFVLLSALFSLTTLVCYLKGRALMSTRPWAGAIITFTALGVLWPLALLSKENAILLVLVLTSVELLFFQSQTIPPAPKRLARTLVAGLFLLPLIFGLLYISTSHEQILLGYEGRPFTLLERLLSQIHALRIYIQLVVAPLPQNMGLFHDDFPTQRTFDLWTFLTLVALLSILVLAVLLRKALPLFAFGCLWFFAWHMLESTFLPLELFFEHRNYLASFGILLAAVAVFIRIAERSQIRPALVAACAAVFVLYAFNTHARAITWSDSRLFAFSEAKRAPQSPRALEAGFLAMQSIGDQTAAERFLIALKEAAPTTTWPVMYRIARRCGQAQIPQEMIQEATQRAEAGYIRPADVVWLSRLATLRSQGNCGALSQSDLYTLGAALGNNKRAHKQSTRVGILNAYARIAAESGDLANAVSSLRDALEIADGGPPIWSHATIQASASIAANVLPGSARDEFLSRVAEGYTEAIIAYAAWQSRQHDYSAD